MTPNFLTQTRRIFMRINLSKVSIVSLILASLGFLLSFSASANDFSSVEKDRVSRRTCRDQQVSLLCNVDGRVRQLRAYTDCGPSRDGSYCDAVYTPGYEQRRMELEWRCERGNWVWVLGDRGWCEVRSYK